MEQGRIFYTVLLDCDGFPIDYCAPPDYRRRTYPIKASDPGESCSEFEAQFGKALCCFVSSEEFAAKVKALGKYRDMQQKDRGMELVEHYVEGLNQAIQAGSDVRTILNDVSVPVISITLDEEAGDLLITFLNKQSPFDKTTHVLLRTTFTVAFTDYPNELRAAGWL